MTTPLETQVRVQLRSLMGFDFQNAIVLLLYLVHDTQGFQDLRKVRDGGCDGLIESEKRAIACYGPDEAKLKKLKTKVESDYAAYAAKWRTQYPQWRVYINRDPSAEETLLVQGLHTDGQLWGVMRVMEAASNLPWHKRVRFYRSLKIDEDLIGRDFLRPIIDDLMAERVEGDVGEYRKRAPDIERKIRANYSPAEVELELKSNELTFEQQAAAMALLTACSETDLNRIKATVVEHYKQTPAGATFGERIDALVQRYRQRYNAGDDDGLTLCIRGFVLWLFAQCLLGAEPSEA
ncbi:hypothetical protein [Polycyclovorans algicola]|uniref:hypothetical protein n=1 Tax=Polycyclovorans algicola TaxID=616992 RepID=UPI0004A6E08C|nr:hypothetical protein [Polycyclovorans algicola]